MAQADYRMATDGTLQETNDALELLAKDSTLGNTNTALGLLAKDSTLGNTNTALGLLAKDATLVAFANALVEVLASVKSVNGKYGVVVLDSGDILFSKNAQNSKTISEMLTEMGLAIAATPLSFVASLISGTESDYKITVSQGAPS